MSDDALDPRVDENKDYFSELVGEGRKYKTPADLGKAYAHADNLIGVLTKRSDEMRDEIVKMREEINSKAKVEDLMDQLSKRQLASSEQPKAKEAPKPEINMDQVGDIIEQKFREVEELKRRKENTTLVTNRLKEAWGDGYQEVLKQKTQELGLTDTFVKDLQGNYPEVLFKTMGVAEAPTRDPYQAPPRNAMRNDSFAPKGAPKRTWAYYQELKKANPNIYFDRKTAVQMAQDAVELGDSFRDGDYYVSGLHEN